MKQSQTDLLYHLLADGKPHRTDEIQTVVYGDDHLGLARVGARIYDLKKKYNVEIEGKHDEGNPSLYWYQLVSLPPLLPRLIAYLEQCASVLPVINKDDLVKTVVGKGYKPVEVYRVLENLDPKYQALIW